MAENHDGSGEQLDEDGNPVKVANLTFIEGIIGKGAYGVVRLARRRAGEMTDRSEDAKVLLVASKSRDEFDATRRRSTGSSDRKRGVGRSVSAPPGDDFFEYTNSESSVYGKKEAEKHENRTRVQTLLRSASAKGHSLMLGEEQLVAVKIFQKSILKRNRTMERDKQTRRMQIKTALQSVEREIALMKKLHHPNLVRFFEAIDSPDSDLLYMVIEYMPLGEILTYQNDGTFRRKDPVNSEDHLDGVVHGHFDEFHAALYFVDILHGLAYLHQHHVCHRALKPENILISARGIARLADFGISHIFDKGESFEEDEGSSNSDEIDGLTRDDTDAALNMKRMSSDGLLTKTEGTWAFWSPEMCEGGNFSGYAADMWAAGVCLYIFVTGKLPFYTDLPYDLFDVIKEGKVPFDDCDLSANLIDLLQMTLDRDPKTRAGVGDCLKHPFLLLPRAQRIQELSVELARSQSTSTIVEDHEIESAFKIVTLNPVVFFRNATKQLQEGFQAAKRRLSIGSNRSSGSSHNERLERFKKKNSFDKTGHLSWTTGNTSFSGNGSLNGSFSGHDSQSIKFGGHDSFVKLGHESAPAIPTCITETSQEMEYDFEDVMQEMARKKAFRKSQDSNDFDSSCELFPIPGLEARTDEDGHISDEDCQPKKESLDEQNGISRMFRRKRSSDSSDSGTRSASSTRLSAMFRRRRSDVSSMSIEEEHSDDGQSAPPLSPGGMRSFVPTMFRGSDRTKPEKPSSG